MFKNSWQKIVKMKFVKNEGLDKEIIVKIKKTEKELVDKIKGVLEERVNSSLM